MPTILELYKKEWRIYNYENNICNTQTSKFMVEGRINMSKIKHQPAFPGFVAQASNEVIYDSWSGITKRELFAAMAMQGAMSNPSCSVSVEDIVKFSIDSADKLIEQLEKD